jgi:hypothetical protein
VGRFARSWQIFKASWHVLRSSKGLTVFPLLSGLASIVVAVSFLTPALFTVKDTHNDSPSAGTYLLFLGFYLVSAYVTIFFNVALISQANVALSGGEPSVSGGLKIAGANWARILPWALLSATVSLVLRAIEERLGFLGRIIVSLVGLAWQLVTYMVLPILVLEGVGTTDAIKRSTDMFKRTWGENVVGNAGIGLFSFLAMLPGFVLIAAGVAAGGATMLVCVALAVLWLIAVAIVSIALSGVYQTALYRYAADGTVVPAFANADLGQAFRPKR